MASDEEELRENRGFALDEDIRDINKETNPLERVVFEIIIHTEEEDIEGIMLYLGQLTWKRNYGTDLTEEITLTFSMESGLFYDKIMRQKDNLECTVKRKWGYEDDEQERVVRYKMFILEPKASLHGSPAMVLNPSAMKDQMTNVTAQLILREYAVLRGVTIHGTYRDTTVKKVIGGLMLQHIQDGMVDDIPIDMDFYFIDPDNETNFEVIIPTGTRLLNLPKFLHKGDYGVYNGSIGTFIQLMEEKPTLFVYPLFNPNLVDEKEKTLEIFVNTDHRGMYNLNNYWLDGEILKVVAPASIQSFDSGDDQISNTGSGYYANDPYSVGLRPPEIDMDKIGHYKEGVMEGKKVKDKKDNNTFMNYMGNDSNLYRIRSIEAKNMMSFFTFEWLRGDPDLIYPGMPCRLNMEDHAKTITIRRGQVQSLYTVYSHGDNSYKTILFIAIEKYSDLAEE